MWACLYGFVSSLSSIFSLFFPVFLHSVVKGIALVFFQEKLCKHWSHNCLIASLFNDLLIFLLFHQNAIHNCLQCLGGESIKTLKRKSKKEGKLRENTQFFTNNFSTFFKTIIFWPPHTYSLSKLPFYKAHISSHFATLFLHWPC